MNIWGIVIAGLIAIFGISATILNLGRKTKEYDNDDDLDWENRPR